MSSPLAFTVVPVAVAMVSALLPACKGSFLLSHDIKPGALDEFVDLTVVGGKLVFERAGQGP